MKIKLVYVTDVSDDTATTEDAVMQATLALLGEIVAAATPIDQLNVYDEVTLDYGEDE